MKKGRVGLERSPPTLNATILPESRQRLYPGSVALRDELEQQPAIEASRIAGGWRWYQQTEGRGLPTRTSLNMMELIATEDHFILLKIQQCEHALWINRTTGAFSIRASWDLAR